MNVVMVATQKGGAGKTTLVTNLAVLALECGPSAIIDMDPQESCSYWRSIRNTHASLTGPEVRAIERDNLLIDLAELEEQGCKTVFLDLPPINKTWLQSVIRCADLVLVPIHPSPYDIHSAVGTLLQVREQNKNIVWVLNRASLGSDITKRVRTELQASGTVCKTAIRQSKDFVMSAGQGLGVSEYAPTSGAAKDVAALWKEISQLLATNHKTQGLTDELRSIT